MTSKVMTALVLLISVGATASWKERETEQREAIITGADQVESYVPYLMGKRVGMVINQSSIIGDRLSVDSLLALGVDVKTIFGPEHGFRQHASNGAVVGDEIDSQTGIPIVSLYGKNRK